MGISDWSSDVCSSDLSFAAGIPASLPGAIPGSAPAEGGTCCCALSTGAGAGLLSLPHSIHSSTATIIQAKIRNVRVWFIRQAGSSRRIDHPTRDGRKGQRRSEEHTSELQSLMRISYAVFCLKT